MTSPNVRELAETLIRRELGARGLAWVAVREDVDHGGEPALFVEAVLERVADRVGGDASSRLHATLSQALLKAGEQRFPYFRVRYLDDERPEGVPPPTEH